MLRRSPFSILLCHQQQRWGSSSSSSSSSITPEEFNKRFANNNGLPEPVNLAAQFYVEGNSVTSLEDVKAAGCNRVIMIGHGLLGSARNWNGTARKIGWNLPKTTAIACLDQRNHGNSPHNVIHSMDAMTSDMELFAAKIVSTLGEDKLESIGLCGHSMSGAATVNLLSILTAKPELLPTLRKYLKSSVIVDICPDRRPVTAFQSIEGIFQAMKTIDFDEHKSYTDADKQIKSTGLVNDAGLRAFVMTNFVPQSKLEPFARWKCNFPTLFAETTSGRLFHELSPVVHDIAKQKIDIPTFFVFGEDSSYNDKEGRARIPILFEKSKQVALPKAGHYVHVEKQDEFAKLVADWYKETMTVVNDGKGVLDENLRDELLS